MSHIIGNKCIDVCDSACVSVCPVDCIHGPIHNDKMGVELPYLKETGELKALNRPQMYIDPETCINCGACLPECPVGAIYEDEVDAIAEGDEESVHRNYEFFGLKYK